MLKKTSAMIILTTLYLFMIASFSCAENYETIEKKFNFEVPQIELKEDSALVKMGKQPVYGAPGEPVLPFKTIRLLLPQGKTLAKVQVTAKGRQTLPNAYKIEHGKDYLSSGIEEEHTAPKKTIYQSDKAFPGCFSSKASIQKKMGYSILVMNLYPVEYKPASGKISYYEELTVTVETSPMKISDMKIWPSKRKDVKEEIAKVIDNQEVLASYATLDPVELNTTTTIIPNSLLTQTTLLNPSQNYQYIIITNEALKNAVSNYSFQFLLQQKSYYLNTDPNAIFTVEWIEATYPGTRPDGGVDLPTKIRNFIKDAYNTWGTQYVLLAGDADGADMGGESGDNIVPGRYLFVNHGSWVENIPADLYYACLDGTFDHNGNGLYGEIDDGENGDMVDLMAEVFVGRAPVDSILEMENFVRKTYEYEELTYPGDTYLKNALLVAKKLNSIYYEGCDFSEALIGISEEGGYSTIGLDSNTWQIDKLHETRQDILFTVDYNHEFKDRINMADDPVHFVNIIAHGYVNYFLENEFIPNIDLLSNTKYFLMYACSCWLGAFDNYGYNFFQPQRQFRTTDSVAEQFIVGEHGAFAFIANSRQGFFSQTSLNGPAIQRINFADGNLFNKVH